MTAGVMWGKKEGAEVRNSNKNFKKSHSPLGEARVQKHCFEN